MVPLRHFYWKMVILIDKSYRCLPFVYTKCVVLGEFVWNKRIKSEKHRLTDILISGFNSMKNFYHKSVLKLSMH